MSSSCAGKSAIWCQQGNFWPRNVAINYSNTEIPFWASIKGTCYTHILLEVTKTQYRRATRSWMTFFQCNITPEVFSSTFRSTFLSLSHYSSATLQVVSYRLPFDGPESANTTTHNRCTTPTRGSSRGGKMQH